MSTTFQLRCTPGTRTKYRVRLPELSRRHNQFFLMLLQRWWSQNRMTKDQGGLSFPLVQAHSHSHFQAGEAFRQSKKGKRKKNPKRASYELRDKLANGPCDDADQVTLPPGASCVFTNSQPFLEPPELLLFNSYYSLTLRRQTHYHG